MAKAKKNLVIVESSKKGKAIEEYLGSDYQVKACLGHLRDLPKSKMGVDIEGGFIPDYIPVTDKGEIIKELKAAADKSEKVYLATDPDREGEAISWHLKELLELPDDKALRVTFNEISKKVVTEGVANPRPINQDKVDAQQARRILDRIVGYQLSPLLWKKIRRGLSAGRVQSVATRLVVDREEEINAFDPQEYWSLEASFDRTVKDGSYTARFHGIDKKMELTNETQVDEIIEKTSKSPFVIKSVKRSDKKRSPSPPFITSTLQQDASRRLYMSPKRTMTLAQQLYEGVDLPGIGAVGLITYMRTDSLRLSEEALEYCKDYIAERYGPEFYNGQPRRFKTKSNAQDAHEAIRPTDVRLDPESIKASLSNDQYKLYKLIWSRYVACQMSNAVYDTVVIDTESAGYIFRANHQSLKFAGFTAVYEESKDDEKEEAQSPLPDLKEGERVKLNKFNKEQHFTQPPSRYNEASLIKAMEDKGFGRPSTYATTVSTILDREYVLKQEKYFVPTPLGTVITGLMKERFQDVIDVSFTAQMEERLDMVEEGKLPWKQVLEDFYEGFHEEMLQAEEALKDTRIKVPDEETEEVCEQCGRKMVIKYGRFGRFLACPGFPDCKNTKPIVEVMPGSCPRCSGRILKRKSQKGYTYYACENVKDCGFMTWDVPVKDDCPSCNMTLFKKSGRGQKKPFCINEACERFVPEDKRGGYKKKTAEDAQPEETKTAKTAASGTKKSAGKAAAKKSTTKKSTTKKTTKDAV